MKKVISVFLALMMCLSLAVPAFADWNDVHPQGGTVDWGPKEPDMCLTLPTEIVVYDDRSGNYTVGTAEVRNAGKAKATITDVQVSPSQGWSLSDWDATRGNVPVDAKTFSMRVFDAAVGSTGHVADTTAFPSLPKDASADMGISFWMAPQRNISGRPQVADVVVTAEFEDLSVYAILYDDGELVFQQGSTPEGGRTVTATYANVETATSCPWGDKSYGIKAVTFNCDVVPVSTANWFYGCSDLTAINGIEKLDTGKVADMESMFDSCGNLISLNVSGWDTSNVTTMKGMFAGCKSLTSLDVSNWNTSNVTTMEHMFGSRTISGRICGCETLTTLDVSNWDTHNVTDMGDMFSSCDNLTTLDVSNWDTHNVTNTYNMFYWCGNLTTLDVSNWDTHNVTNMSNMFFRCGFTSLDVSCWDVSNVLQMGGAFEYSKCTTLDLSGWNTSSLTRANYMFAFSDTLKTIYVSPLFTVDGVEYCDAMFYFSKNLVGGNGTKYSSSYIGKEYARIDAPGAPGYFTAAPSVALLDATMDAAMLDGMAAPGLDAVTGPAEPVPELPSTGDGTYEVDPDTGVVEVPETPIFDVEPETPEVPTEPSEPEEPAGDQAETPDEGATEPESGEEPAEKPDDVPASPDVEPSQDPEPAANPDDETPEPDAGNQDGDGEGVPDAETPEDAPPPATGDEPADETPEDTGEE